MPQAAIWFGPGNDLALHDVELLPPRAGDVRVKLDASGVCHSDLNVIQYGEYYPRPMVLGHEGTGTVLEVGDGVTNVAPGDTVILSAVPRCGTCYWCRRGQFTTCEKMMVVGAGTQLDGEARMFLNGEPIYQFCGLATFAEETVVPSISVVKIEEKVPVEVAALIGCGVVTGWGAARRTVNIGPHDSVVVMGCGGVGLNVVQGAALAGARQIIGVDILDEKLELARKFGATDTVNASQGDPVEQVIALTGGRGADFGFEVLGKPIMIQQMVAMVRRGGTATLVGIPEEGYAIPAIEILGTGKRIQGCLYGSADILEDFPGLVSDYHRGTLKVDELVTRRIDLDGVNEAFEIMKTGKVARSVIVY